MNDQLTMEYLKITGGAIPSVYIGPEEQGQRIVKCSLLKETNLAYSSSTNVKIPSSNLGQ